MYSNRSSKKEWDFYGILILFKKEDNSGTLAYIKDLRVKDNSFAPKYIDDILEP